MKNPLRQLWDTCKFALRVLIVSAGRYSADQHNQRAVALTYYTLFAIVPIAALSFGIAKGFDMENRLRQVLDSRFSQHEELLKYVYQFADTTLKQASGGLVAGVGVIALIWTVMWLAGNIEKAFNAVWGLPPRKNLLRKFSDYLAIVLLMPIILVIMGSAGVFMRALFNNLSNKLAFLGSAPGYLLNLAGSLTPLVIAIVIFSLIYITSPNTKVRIMPAVFAGIIAGICFQILQDGFIYLQGSIYRYNRIYGSFAALPLFLIWTQWSWQIALFGAEIGFVAQELDTGLFDNDTDESSSPRSRRVLQIAAASLIYKKFVNGDGFSSFSELQQILKVPAVRLNAELAVLVRNGILFRTETGSGEHRYVPALPPESTTVTDCCQKLNNPGIAGGTALAAATETLADFDRAAELSDANRKIFEL